MPVGGIELGLAQLGLGPQQLARRFDVTRHEDAEGDLQALDGSLVETGQLGRSFRGKLVSSFYFFNRQLAQIFVDNVADMLKIDGERYDLHGAAAFAIIEAVA